MRCRNVHPIKSRIELRGGDGLYYSTCPRCKARPVTVLSHDECMAEIKKAKHKNITISADDLLAPIRF